MPWAGRDFKRSSSSSPLQIYFFFINSLKYFRLLFSLNSSSVTKLVFWKTPYFFMNSKLLSKKFYIPIFMARLCETLLFGHFQFLFRKASGNRNIPLKKRRTLNWGGGEKVTKDIWTLIPTQHCPQKKTSAPFPGIIIYGSVDFRLQQRSWENKDINLDVSIGWKNQKIMEIRLWGRDKVLWELLTHDFSTGKEK